MKNIFKNNNRVRYDCYGQKVFKSAEDENTVYWDFPDGLRLIFRDGKYVGWYLPEGRHGK